MRRVTLAKQEALILEHMPLVSVIAGRLYRAYPTRRTMTELRADGYVGLVEAAHRFTEGTSCSFRTFAGIRIHGAMLDGLRRDQAAGGFSRRRGRLARVNQWPLDDNGAPSDLGLVDAAPDPHELYVRKQRLGILSRLPMTARERQAMELLMAGADRESAAKQMGVSISLVDQLRRRVIAKAAEFR